MQVFGKICIFGEHMKSKICITIFCVVIVMSVINIGINVWNESITQTNNSRYFLSGEYVSYNGGSDAAIFFEKYVDVRQYKEIAFYYGDYEKMISPLKWIYNDNVYTVFVVDVYYDNTIFYDVSSNILSELDQKDLKNVPKNYFDGYKIEDSDSSLYTNNCAMILFFEYYKTIRFVFICDCKNGAIEDVHDLISWSMPLPWNSNGDDWMFDYSDLMEIGTLESST